MKNSIIIATFFAALFCFPNLIFSQGFKIQGKVLDESQEPIAYSNLALYSETDSTLVKVETTDDEGLFEFQNIQNANYYLISSFIGYEDLIIPLIEVGEEDIDLGTLTQNTSSVQLETAVVKAKRAMVEVKPDRTVFNVQGTINSAGEDGLNLLRKAPGVLLDNNDNITVLGRSGVLMYVDGKRLPLAGDELTNYLRNLTAEQIDRIDIISNPGAKYEAEGNAGIIDIRLKKDKNLGYNGSISSTVSKGRALRANVLLTSNYRNKNQNIFGSLGYNDNESNQTIVFDQALQNFADPTRSTRVYENGLFLSEEKNFNYKLGTDFFISPKSTFGFLINGSRSNNENSNSNTSVISSVIPESFSSTPFNLVIPEDQIDSVLIASINGDGNRNSNSFNLNYVFSNADQQLNVDADYGRYRNDQTNEQPNNYRSADQMQSLGGDTVSMTTPINIDIYTFKVDYEKDALGGKIGFGTKYSDVSTENTFLFFDKESGAFLRNDEKSNEFYYDENVIAGYFSYVRQLTEKWNLSSGLRVEQTMTNSELIAYKPELAEEPVDSSYLSFFPNLGLTYAASRRSTLSFSYGRRINRPDYNVLNPFKTQVTELGFSIGDPRLQPEIVNNLELGWTFDYRYNFKLAYSKTTNQITRLLGQDDVDERASFINFDNLGEQVVYGLNISAPFQFTEKWSSFWNLSVRHLSNSSDDGSGNIIDLNAWTYNIFQQQTFTLPKGFTGEISGWFAGPGIWGGVFQYETQWSLNLGLQKKFFNDQLNAKISATDIFNQAFWSGFSEYDGLLSHGSGNFDNQRISLSLTYNFGNANVKSRNRKTGIEEESGRVGG